MQSDVIHVSADGTGMEKALQQAELVASYKSLPHKDALHLRLLSEEMMGMLRALTGEHEADFWIDDAEGVFKLHLQTETMMNAQMREKLLSASTTGHNAAAKGFMGKIRDVFNRLLEPFDDSGTTALTAGMLYDSAIMGSTSLMATSIWSLNQYKTSLEQENAPQEAWDEMEKSIVGRLADEIQIFIAERTVEMVIYKKF